MHSVKAIMFEMLKKGISISELSAKTGTSKNILREYLSGDCSIKVNLLKIAEVLDIDKSVLFGLDTAQRIDKVEVIKVIAVRKSKGNGTPESPVDHITEYWDFEGNKIAEKRII